jgi:hypothetical protein
MYSGKVRALTLGVLLSVISVGSQAGMFKGWDADYPKKLASLTVMPTVDATAVPEEFRPLVVLRFPASARKEDLESAREAYRWKHAKGDDLKDVFGEREMDKYALDMLFVKSMYHALEVHSCVKARTSDVADLVLEPYEIRKNGEKWVRSGAEIPHSASLVIDFYARTEAHSMAMTYLTFGPRYEPFFNLRASSVALPETGGAIAGHLVHNPLIASDPGYADFDARSGLGVDFIDFLNAPALKKKSFAGWAKLPAANIPAAAVIEVPPWRKGSYLALPVVSLGMELDEKGVASTSEREDCAVIANLTRASIAHLKAQSAGEHQRLLAFISQFDTTLAATLTPDKALSAEDAERLKLLKTFYAAEMSFLKQQDARLQKEILNGPWADSFHTARAEEARNYTKRKVGIGAMLLVAGAGTASAAAGGVGSSLTTLAFYEQTEARLSTDLAQLRGPQVTLGDFVFEVSTAGQKITAKTSEELRAALKQLYQGKYPSAP